MNALSLEGKIHFIYDRAFDDIKKEVFANWILEALSENNPLRQTKQHIEAFFEKKLRFNIHISQRTHTLFEETLNELVHEKKLISLIRLDNQTTQAYVYREEGKSWLDDLIQQRESLLDTCYLEFAALFYKYFNGVQNTKKAAYEKSRLNGTSERNEPLPYSSEGNRGIEFVQWFNQLFAGNNTRDAFFQYLEWISPAVAERSVTKAFQIPAIHGTPESVNLNELDNIFPLASLQPQETREQVHRTLIQITKRFFDINFADTSKLQYWFYLRTYQLIFEKLWPDEDVREYLTRYLECTHVYLDTNVIIAALSPADPLHSRARQILEFLFDNSISVFWLQITELELKGHLELSQEIVRLLSTRPEREIFEIIDMSQPPSFVKTYFLYSWRSWDQFYSDVLNRYESIRQRSQFQSMNEWIQSQDDFVKLRDKHRSAYEQQLNTKDRKRHPAKVRHDAYVLATVQSLREMVPDVMVSKTCKDVKSRAQISLGELFWLVSFDRNLSKYGSPSSTGVASKEQVFPLTLFYETIMLFLDPHIVGKALNKNRSRYLTSDLDISNRVDIRQAIRLVSQATQTIRDRRETPASVSFLANYIEQTNIEMLEKFSSFYNTSTQE